MTTPQKSGSQMSSRLLTMKFMQRAAASSTPNSSSKQQNTPENPNQPPTKRRKTDTDLPHSRDANAADLAAVHAALAAEEEKRQRALDRQAAEAGDTKWQIKVEPTRATFLQPKSLEVMSAGYGFIDGHEDAAGDGEVEEEAENRNPSVRMGRIPGRRSFGNFGKPVEPIRDPDQSDSLDSDSNTSNSDSDNSSRRSKTRSKPKNNTSEAGSRLRAELTLKRKREKADAAQLADRRRSKEVKLNKLSSISSGGGLSSRPSLSGVDNRTCYKCGEKGHTQRDCPGGGSGRGKGRRSM